MGLGSILPHEISMNLLFLVTYHEIPMITANPLHEKAKKLIAELIKP